MGNTVHIEAGDYVVDDSEIWVMHKVSYIMGNEIYLEDGGVMSINDVVDVMLPGEVEGYN